MNTKFWTKKNVEKMESDRLVEWNNKAFQMVEDGKRLNVEPKAAIKALKLCQAELKRRKMI